MTAPLVGLIGKKRSGKDSVAAALTTNHNFKRIAFADPLKKTLLDLNPVIPQDDGLDRVLGPQRLAELVDCLGWEEAKEIPEVRRLMQAHGVAIREHVSFDVWLNAAMQKVVRVREGRFPYDGAAQPVVITDVRFHNEAAAIRAAGGSLVRVHRPSLVSTDNHRSETELDEYRVDHIIWNTGTLEDLTEQATLLVKQVAP